MHDRTSNAHSQRSDVWAGVIQIGGVLQIVLTAPITANATLQVFSPGPISGAFTSIQVTPAPGQQCSVSGTPSSVGGGLAVLISVTCSAAPPPGSTATGATTGGRSERDTALIGGLVGGVLGLFAVIGVLAFVSYKRRTPRCLWHMRTDKDMIIT